jgi:hypothetical protein
MAKVQDEFSRMLRDEIAPALRRLGFKGSGRNYTLPDPDFYLLLGFQGGRYNTADEVTFTVNLAVINKQEWEDGWECWWSKVPTATANHPVGQYMRLGHLMPQKQDYWWEMTAGTSTPELVEEVVNAIHRYGIPEMLWVKETHFAD